MLWQKFYGRKPSQEWEIKRPKPFRNFNAFQQMKNDLIEFHRQHDQALPEVKLAGLIEMQTRNYHFRNRMSTRKRREAFVLNKSLRRFFKRRCYVCREPSQCRHHVISLKQGGTPTAKRNIVALCSLCHAKIHPWLTYA